MSFVKRKSRRWRCGREKTPNKWREAKNWERNNEHLWNTSCLGCEEKFQVFPRQRPAHSQQNGEEKGGDGRKGELKVEKSLVYSLLCPRQCCSFECLVSVLMPEPRSTTPPPTPSLSLPVI